MHGDGHNDERQGAHTYAAQQKRAGVAPCPDAHERQDDRDNRDHHDRRGLEHKEGLLIHARIIAPPGSGGMLVNAGPFSN